MKFSNVKLSNKTFELLQKDNRVAFEEVYDLYFPILYSKINRLCKESELCQDIIQESFVQLYLHKHMIKDKEGIFPFLYIVSRRLAISSFRKCVSRMEYQNYIEDRFEEADHSLLNTVIEKDFIQQLEEIIKTLPQQQAKIFTLNKLEDMSYKEIAEYLDLSSNTVRNQIANATKAIRLKVTKLLTVIFF